MTEHRKLTREQLLAEASERFGKDPMGWAFKCPRCADVATGQDFKNALADHPRKHTNGEKVLPTDIFGQECLGRTLPKGGRGCDWAAYGLFRGPWEIVMSDGRSMWCFPLADAPEIAEPPAAFAQALGTVSPGGGDRG